MLLSQKKILVVSNNPFYGGGEAFVLSTLARVGADMNYVVSCDKLYTSLPRERVNLFGSASKRMQIQQIKRIIKELKPGIVIFNGGSTIFFAPFIRNVRKIIYKHTTNDATGSGIRRFLYILAQHLSYPFAEKIIHVSEFSLSEQKLCRSKATFVHHGAEPMEYVDRPLNTPLKFLFVGRTDHSKGLDIIVDAFLGMPHGSAQLDIVGTGEMAEYLEKLDHSNIKYHGFSSDVNHYYQNCDVMVTLPSFEAFGLTILEAMNNSLPVIVSAVGAIPELITDGANGIIVERKVRSLRNAIDYLTVNKERIKQMGRRANETAREKFSIFKTVSEIEKIIAE